MRESSSRGCSRRVLSFSDRNSRDPEGGEPRDGQEPRVPRPHGGERVERDAGLGRRTMTQRGETAAADLTWKELFRSSNPLGSYEGVLVPRLFTPCAELLCEKLS